MDKAEVVCIIDDDEAVRQSVSMLIGSLQVDARPYASARDFLADPDKARCGCLVTDVRMPGLSGLELQARLIREGIRIPVIFITGHGDVPMAVQAMRNGAVDFLLKPFNHQALLDKVQLALEEGREARLAAGRRQAVETRLASLSKREREVLDLIVAGQMNKVVAAQLGISPKTVECHRASIMEKMQAHSLAELVQQIALLSN